MGAELSHDNYSGGRVGSVRDNRDLGRGLRICVCWSRQRIAVQEDAGGSKTCFQRVPRVGWKRDSRIVLAFRGSDSDDRLSDISSRTSLLS
jgi:hypothetical protein